MIDWPAVRLKHLASIHGRIGWHGLSTEDYREVGEFLVTGTEVIDGRVAWHKCHRVASEIWERDPQIQLANGDVLITKDGSIGKVALVTELEDRATLNSGLFRVRTQRDRLLPDFLYWVLRSALFSGFIRLLSAGSTINHLYQKDFVNFAFQLPSATEQVAIARFLQSETSRIGSLIAKKRHMIGLLEERRAQLLEDAMMGHGVRLPRVLDPDWQAISLPVGWKAMRLSQVLVQLTNGYVGPTRDVLVEEGVKYVQSLHIKGGRIDFQRRPFFVPEDWHAERARIHLRPGDVLIVQTGDIGQVAVVPEGFGEASCHALQIARVRSELLSGHYLAEYLRTPFGYESLLSRATGALHPHLEGGIKDVPVIVPPKDVQVLLLKRVDDGRARILKLSDTLTHQMDLLAEHRQALITAAVTGELQVAA